MPVTLASVRYTFRSQTLWTSPRTPLISRLGPLQRLLRSTSGHDQDTTPAEASSDGLLDIGFSQVSRVCRWSCMVRSQEGTTKTGESMM